MEGEPERAKLAAEFPGWEIGRRSYLVIAWLPTEIPVVLRSRSVAGLRKKLLTFEAMLYPTGSLNRAEYAAERIETT